MANLNGGNFPIQGQGSDLLLGEVNRQWGAEGAGTIEFWRQWDPMVYRDTVATGPSRGKGLRFPNGFYKLIVCEGMRYERVPDDAIRSLTTIAGKIMLGPARAERVDGPAVPFDVVSPTADPEGDIELAVRQSFNPWADFLPMQGMISLLVNGRVSIAKEANGNYKYPLQTPYTQEPYAANARDGYFSKKHLVNPLNGAASKTFPNLIELAAPANEDGWAQAKDVIVQTPDLDGVTLPNAQGMLPPLVMVPTWKQWRRWAHILGGPNVPKELIQQGDRAGIHSVFVGDAELQVNPYLQTLNDPANAVDITKRTFVFPRRGRKVAIYREEVAPLVKDTGEVGAKAHESNQRVLYIQARDTWILGEPRSGFEIREPK